MPGPAARPGGARLKPGVRRRRKLRVAHPPNLRGYSRASGNGKVWHQVLDGLEPLVELMELDPGSHRRRSRPDVWISNGHEGPLAVRSPVVCGLHEAAWDLPETRASLAPSFLARYERLSADAAARATRIVTLSWTSRRQIVDCYGRRPDDVTVVSPGVDHGLFHPGAARPGVPLGPTDVEPWRPYVLFVSQLHPRKNLPALRAAVAKLLDDGFVHRLVLVGGPPVDNLGDDAVRELTSDIAGHPGSVLSLRGLTDVDLARVVAGAAVFCQPSLMEGFGLSVLEAMASGVPVVVSDRGALPEVVAGAGLVVPPDAEHLWQALATLLGDEAVASDLGRRALERSADFDQGVIGPKWLDVLLAMGAP